jgi:hypothetical protein
MEIYSQLPRYIKDRTIQQKYINKNLIVIWDGKYLKCEHNRIRTECKDCGGGSICEHNKRRSICKDCGGGSICEHNKRRSICKDCGGSSICKHSRRRTQCKDCGGGSICKHNRQRSNCKDCGGGSICKHKRIRSSCKDCGGASICEHNKRRRSCKDCGGASICEHSRQRSHCKDCGGGSRCEHKKIRSRCKDCGGGSICKHSRQRSQCKVCEPNSHLICIMRGRVGNALKNFSSRKNKKHTMEYVGCSLEILKIHLENKFIEGMTWENQGEWHIDHIKPCASFDLDIEEERHKCFHYTNLQPLWGPDNISKSDYYDEDEEERQWNGNEWM